MNTGIAGLQRPTAYIPQAAIEREPLLIQDMVLHRLQTPNEIKGIVGLRDEIDLSAHTAAGRQQFERLEKKETSAGSCSVSSSAVSGSARSASCPWANN